MRSRPALAPAGRPAGSRDESRPGPSAAAEEGDRREHVLRMLAGLPEEQRRVVEMRFFGDASLQDIATALDCPEGTVNRGCTTRSATPRENRMKPFRPFRGRR
ncbi:MAG: sigma-70 family RNA polymerase sigma factor [Kiritimatiellia bacterium]